MVFATAVAFYFQSVYGSFTIPAFVALIVGYMFKDRIKQFRQTMFAGKLQANLFDRRIHIKTLDGKYKLATLREKITFMKESEIPQEVRSARQGAAAGIAPGLAAGRAFPVVDAHRAEALQI